jgi:hypothetical protein
MAELGGEMNKEKGNDDGDDYDRGDRASVRRRQQLQQRRIGRGPDGVPLYFNKANVTRLGFDSYADRKMRIYEDLELMYTKGQVGSKK